MPYKDKNSPEAIASRKRRAKKYYEKNKEKIALKNKTDPVRIKSLRINNWKQRGVVGDYDALYILYNETQKCNCCEYIFLDNKNKCLDHDHSNGEFRQILCRNCNNFDNWENKK